ncbi:MAG: hypothetical protein KA369_20890 [Spirochaetes bacterium]|nr:hypothetical protein [Spirochaetota bacterium]
MINKTAHRKNEIAAYRLFMEANTRLLMKEIFHNVNPWSRNNIHDKEKRSSGSSRKLGAWAIPLAASCLDSSTGLS